MESVTQEYLESLPHSERHKLSRKVRKQQLRKYKEWAKEHGDEVVRRAASRKRIAFTAGNQLQDAVKCGDAEEVASLLKKGGNPNICFEYNGFSLLHQCCMDDNYKIAKLLLAKGAGVGLVDADLWTPLHVACSCAGQDLVLLLLEYGADVLMLNVDNCLPVDLVADADVQQLLYDEMEKKGISGLDEIRQLRQSKASAMLADIRKAVPTGLDLDALTDQGVAPIHIAAANGYGDVIKYLVKKGANVDLQDESGCTPLHVAARFGQERMVRYLLKKGANPLIEDWEGSLPIDVSDTDVIVHVLSTVTEEVRRKQEIEHRLQQDAQLGSDTASSLADSSFDLPVDREGTGHNGDLGTDLSPEGEGESSDFSCGVKPRAYSRSFLRALSMSQVEEMFEAETLAVRAAEGVQEEKAKESMRRSSKKIKDRLKEAKPLVTATASKSTKV